MELYIQAQPWYLRHRLGHARAGEKNGRNGFRRHVDFGRKRFKTRLI